MRGLRELFPRAKHVRHTSQRRNRLQRRLGIECGRRPTRGRRTKAAARSDQSPGPWRNLPVSFEKTGQGGRLRNGRRRSCRKALGAVERIAAERWRYAFIRQEWTGY